MRSTGALAEMAKKNVQPPAGRKGKKRGGQGETGLIRVHADLQWKAAEIAEWDGVSVAELVDPVLRPLIEAGYARVIRAKTKEIPPGL